MTLTTYSSIDGVTPPNSLEFEVKITKKTIEKMLVAKINDIALQISGFPKYSMPFPGPVEHNLETIKTRIALLGSHFQTNSFGFSEDINNFLN